MKIAFYVYPTAFQNPGGGEVQLLKTKEYLEKEGLTVTLFDPWRHKLQDFDILHTFGSVKEALPMMEAARCAGIKNVLSTICWYNWRSSWGASVDLRTRLLSLLRHTGKVVCPFLSSQRKRMMDISDMLMPNSQSEAEQLECFFLAPRRKIKVIPNGVDPVFEKADPRVFRDKYSFRDFVLCVGRIEPRKNQLNMIRAMSGLDVPFVVIGDPVKHYPAYAEACRRAAGKNVHFLGPLPHDSELLRSAYAACDTFLLASWLETPGLAALEAALAGAKVVITPEGATREYFGEFAAYASPHRIDMIRQAVQKSLLVPRSSQLAEHVRKNFLWPVTAKKILAAYRPLLEAAL